MQRWRCGTMGTSDTETNEYGYGSSGGDTGKATEATGTGRNSWRWTIFCSASALGSIVGNGVRIEGQGGHMLRVRGGNGGNKDLGLGMKRRESN